MSHWQRRPFLPVIGFLRHVVFQDLQQIFQKDPSRILLYQLS